MTGRASVRLAIEVAVDPATAFEVFTADIDAWYRKGPHSFSRPSKAVGIRFEPRVGGRLVEVHDIETGEGHEMARITVWQPGRRVVFVDSRGSEVDVSFDEVDDGTRVVLEHRGLDRLPPGQAAVRRTIPGWPRLLDWFGEHMRARVGS